MVLGAVCAIIASLERILGRPIPRLRYSRPVRKNRAFAIVPLVMVMVFSWALFAFLRMQVCDHCTYPYAWQRATAIIGSLVMAFGLSGAVGWIVFAVVLIASLSMRLAARLVSN